MTAKNVANAVFQAVGELRMCYYQELLIFTYTSKILIHIQLKSAKAGCLQLPATSM